MRLVSFGRTLRLGGGIATFAAALTLGTTATAQAFTAPDPGGNENGPIAVPAPGKYFGINEDFTDYAHSQSPASYASYANAMGANVVKMNLEWWRAERYKQGEWVPRRWDVWKQAYDAMRAKGITPILMLTSAPCWARPDPAKCQPGDASESLRYPPDPAFDQDWVDFVTKVATEFPDSIIQVWNEPNLAIWWRPKPDPARWAHLLKLAYNAVHAVEVANPGQSTPVIGPGITNLLTSDGNTNLSMHDFLTTAYTATDPMKSNLDALSANVFPYSDQFGANTELAASFDQLRSTRSANGDTGAGAVPIYVTETGLGAGSSYGWTSTETQRAFALYRLYNRLMTMPDVGMVVFHRLIEPQDSNTNPLEWGYAWMHYVPPSDPTNPQTQAPGLPEPKPVFCLFADLAKHTYQPCLKVTITSGPPPKTSNRNPSFTFEHPQTLSERYQCRIDDAVPVGCDARNFTTQSKLAEGEHTFFVLASDAAGDVGTTTQTFTVKLPDTKIQDATIDAHTRTATITFKGTGATKALTYECSLDGAAFAGCSSPVAYKHLRRGRHTFAVRTRDAEGTVDRTPAKTRLKVS